MRALWRTSSCVPAWMDSSTLRERSVARSAKISFQAGFAFTTSSGGRMFGFFGYTAPSYRCRCRSAAM